MLGTLPDDVAQALDERAALIEDAAREAVDRASRDREPWLGATLGPGVTLPEADREALVAVAAYRARYGIDDDEPPGTNVTTLAQRSDRERTAAALRSARPIETSVRRSGHVLSPAL